MPREKVWTPAMFIGGPSSLPSLPVRGDPQQRSWGSSALSTPTSATFSLHSDTDDEERYRKPGMTQQYRRRRSTIVPEKIFGDPVGKGPLRIGAFFRPSKPEHQLMTWPEILEIITRGDLELLLRHPDCEKEYMSWAKSIKQHYGGLEQYIARERIGWGGENQPSDAPAMDNSQARSPQLSSKFFDDEAAAAAERENSSVVRVVFNDWPYAVPLDCQHYVVWSKYTIIDDGLFESSDTPFPVGPLRDVAMQGINSDGIRGATGTGGDVTPIGHQTPVLIREVLQGPNGQQLLSSAHAIFEAETQSSTPPSSLDEQVFILSKVAHKWAARFANRFIEQHWAVDDFETAWFCNPPHLRTVPGLSHFHVIVRPRPPPAGLMLSTS